MDKRTKLGVAATSLAAAAAMIGPTQASAEDCITCPPAPGDGDFVFWKIDAAFDDLFDKIDVVAPRDVFLKLDDVFIKLSQVFMKE